MTFHTAQVNTDWDKCWKIHQKYSPGVLMLGWDENRLEFERKNYNHNSTYRINYRHYPDARPDVTIRRNGLHRSTGLSPHLLLHHHGSKYNDNMHITTYDEYYNHNRVRTNPLPPLRNWNGRYMSWIPEKSDFPAEGKPTNWGLREEKEAKVLQQQAEDNIPTFSSTYQLSYLRPEKTAFLSDSQRFATQRSMSTILNKSNSVLKDQVFRGRRQLRMPEFASDPAGVSKVSHAICAGGE